MPDETFPIPSGIQLRLMPPRNASSAPPSGHLSMGEISNFGAMVLFVLANLTVEDQQRVLSWASQHVHFQPRKALEATEVLRDPDQAEDTRS